MRDRVGDLPGWCAAAILVAPMDAGHIDALLEADYRGMSLVH